MPRVTIEFDVQGSTLDELHAAAANTLTDLGAGGAAYSMVVRSAAAIAYASRIVLRIVLWNADVSAVSPTGTFGQSA